MGDPEDVLEELARLAFDLQPWDVTFRLVHSNLYTSTLE